MICITDLNPQGAGAGLGHVSTGRPALLPPRHPGTRSHDRVAAWDGTEYHRPLTSPGWSCRASGHQVSLGNVPWAHTRCLSTKCGATDRLRGSTAGLLARGHHGVFVILVPAHVLLGCSHSRVMTGPMCVEDQETSCWFMLLRRTGKVRLAFVSVGSPGTPPGLTRLPAGPNFQSGSAE